MRDSPGQSGRQAPQSRSYYLGSRYKMPRSSSIDFKTFTTGDNISKELLLPTNEYLNSFAPVKRLPKRHVGHGYVLGSSTSFEVCFNSLKILEAITTSDTDHRTLTAAAVLLSVTVWSGILDPYYVVFLTYKIFNWRKLPEIWRFVTPFLLTGPKLALLLDPYFLYTYGSQLETNASRFSQPGDFFIYLVFCAVVILVSEPPRFTLSVFSPPATPIPAYHLLNLPV